MILSNQIKCKLCGDTPYSAHVHDFKHCKCEAVAVDGGTAYLRRSGIEYEEMSIDYSDDLIEALKNAIIWSQENKRNDLGLICAIARYVRDAGFEIKKANNHESSVKE